MNHIVISLDEKKNACLLCSDPRAQHVLHVLKTPIGSSFRAGVLNDSCGIATLRNIDTGYIYFDYTSLTLAEAPLPITLLIGGTRPIVMQRILRDATAFGVEKFMVVHTKNSEKSYLNSNLWQAETYKNSLYEGLALARAVTMPNVERYFNLEEAFDKLSTSCRIIADVNSTDSLAQLTYEVPFTLAVGPERGFTNTEIELAQRYNFVSGHLGQRIIRSETACFVALALASTTAGLF